MLHHKLNHVLGSSLLVAGTCIGAGMLGLPIKIGPAGFYNILVLFLVSWVFMLTTAFYMLEATFYCPGETNLISMMQKTVGKYGRWFAWIMYLAFFYSLMTAYVAGGSAIFGRVIEIMFSVKLFSPLVIVGYVGLFAFIVAYGTEWVDAVNRILMTGLILSYFVLIAFVSPHADFELLANSSPGYVFPALPLVIATFGFHLLVPSLKQYLHAKPAQLKQSIFWGSIISLCIYCVWLFVILGMIPIDGPDGLIALGVGGEPNVRLTQVIDARLSTAYLGLSVQLFTLTALLSSFIGVSLSLFDFFADGLSIKKTHGGKLKLIFLTFGVPLLFAVTYPEGFLSALQYAGLFGVVLLVLFPVAMVWCGRYRHQLKSEYQVYGGKVMLFLCFAFGMFAIVIQLI